MTNTENRSDLKTLFNHSRLTGTSMDTFLLLLYSPLGIILAIVRIFMLFHIFALTCIFPKSFNLFRIVYRFMLMVCGLSVRMEGEEERRGVRPPVLISNYISPLDRIVVDLVYPNHMANEWDFPLFVSWIFGLKDVSVTNNRESFLNNVKKLCQESAVPLFTRPEGTPTSGTKALLKFSTWQFSVSNSVQPVVIQARRPMPIALTVLDSLMISDIFWFLFSPYTLFTVRVLPVIHREEDATPEQFAENVRQAMAAGLGVTASNYSRHDKYEVIKRLARERMEAEQVTEDDDRHRQAGAHSNIPGMRSPVISSQPLSPELEQLVLNCKTVVPQVPLDVLRKDILKTKDVDITLSNILAGNIQYEPENLPVDRPQAKSQQPADSSLSKFSAKSTPAASTSTNTYAASQFSKRSNLRHMSLAERKAAMLREARLRYIQKHNLPFTIEQIESGRL